MVAPLVPMLGEVLGGRSRPRVICGHQDHIVWEALAACSTLSLYAMQASLGPCIGSSFYSRCVEG